MNGSPSQAKSLGEELKRLREAAGVSLDEIIAETKVSRRILEGIESGKYQFLPEKVFCRNFVRQYATFIGAEQEPLVESFDVAWDRFLLASGAHPAVLIEEPLKPPIKFHFWIPTTLAIIVVLVLAIIMLRGNAPMEELGVTARGSTEHTRSQPVLPSMASSPTPHLQATPVDERTEVEEAPVDIVVIVDEGKECWIHYRDRDGNTGQQLLRGGERVPLQLPGPILLSLGNAGSVSLLVSGREYRDLGRPGQVIHCEVSSEGLVKLGS